MLLLRAGRAEDVERPRAGLPHRLAERALAPGNFNSACMLGAVSAFVVLGKKRRKKKALSVVFAVLIYVPTSSQSTGAGIVFNLPKKSTCV